MDSTSPSMLPLKTIPASAWILPLSSPREAAAAGFEGVDAPGGQAFHVAVGNFCPNGRLVFKIFSYDSSSFLPTHLPFGFSHNFIFPGDIVEIAMISGQKNTAISCVPELPDDLRISFQVIFPHLESGSSSFARA